MSTFVFAPSWVTYPNHPKSKNNNICCVYILNPFSALKEEADEFPTLISHNKNNNTSNKKENNVWSNPSLIQKIHHSGDEEDEEEVDFEEKRYELERLKALVPKTKNSLSTSSSTTILKRSIRHKPLKILNKQSPILKEPTIVIPTTKTPDPPPKYYISEQEQQHFIYFIKSWTSTGIISDNINNYHNNNYNREYSYFSNNISSNSSHSSNSSDSSFQSDTTLYTRNSYFHHDPF